VEEKKEFATENGQLQREKGSSYHQKVISGKGLPLFAKN